MLFLKKLLLTEENRTQNSCKERDKASKSVFDLKTTGDFLGNYSSKLPFMGRQGEQKSNGLPTGEGGELSALQVLDVKVQRNLLGSARE